MAASSDARYWRRRIRAVQWQVNTGWVVEALQPTLFLGATALTILILLGRREGWRDQVFAIATAGIATLILVLTIARSRKRLISEESARAELESRLHLNSRLSAAAAGICAWPKPAEWRGGGWRWQWRRVWLIPVVSTALIVAAFNIPVPDAQRRSTLPAVKPPALATVEQWIEDLEQNQSIEPSSLETVKEQADQLGNQAPEDWYSHASLEAADHLQSQLKDGMQALSQGAAAVKGLLGIERTLSESEAKRWKEQLDGALAAMEGTMPSLSRALGQQLHDLDASKLRSLSPEQMQQLQKAMNQLRGKGEGKAGEGDAGEGEEGEGNDGENGGGGVDRGPGHPPLKLSSTPTDLHTDKTEALESEDLSRAALGDLAGVSDGQHQVDKEAEHRAAQGGAAASPGAGPEAVWIQQSLPPEERQRLRQFYQ